MGNKRKMKSLKGNTLKKYKINSFSTVKNIQVIDESLTNARPSDKSDTEKNRSSKDVKQTIKYNESRTDEVMSDKVRKRKLAAPEKLPDLPITKSNNKSTSHKQKKPEEAANAIDGAENEIGDEDEANIKDEDIDKFCDEIDDADNEQYEMWVKLVEAKLREKKK